MYLTSRGGGVYRSTDMGRTWALTNTAPGWRPSPRSASRRSPPTRPITAGVYGGLFLTTDGGAHWKKLAGPYGRVTAVLYPDRTGRVLVGDGRGNVYASDRQRRDVDDGDHRGQQRRAISALGAAPTAAGAPTTVFAGTTTGKVFVSNDSGSLVHRDRRRSARGAGQLGRGLARLRDRSHRVGVDVPHRRVPVDRRRATFAARATACAGTTRRTMSTSRSTATSRWRSRRMRPTGRCCGSAASTGCSARTTTARTGARSRPSPST